MIARRCDQCVVWNQYPKKPGAGECRRYAPRPSIVNVEAIVNWPETNAEDWCGEWELRAQPEPT